MAGPERAARDLRRRVGAAPDQTLSLDTEEVVRLLSPPESEYDDPQDVTRFAQSLLTIQGVRTAPALGDGATSITLQADERLALQGAVAVAVLAFVLGAVGRPLYGVLLALAGGAGVAAVKLGFDWLDERLPDQLPRGRVLGACVSLALVAVMFVAVVEPIRASGRDTRNPGFAASLLDGARQSLAAGDLKTAGNRIVQAEQADPTNPYIDDVRADLVVARVSALLKEQDRKTGVYEQATRAFAAGDRRRALRLMSSLGAFRDAPQLVREYRAALARHGR